MLTATQLLLLQITFDAIAEVELGAGKPLPIIQNSDYYYAGIALANIRNRLYFLTIRKLHVNPRADIEKLVKNQYVAAMFTRSHSETSRIGCQPIARDIC